MPNFRNIDIQDQGVNWVIDLEYQAIPGQGDYVPMSVSLPSDLSELPGPAQDNYSYTEQAMLAVVDAIGRQRGNWE